MAMAMATAHDELPFWRVNMPPEQWPAECPEFLRDISEKDQRIIGTPDESYTFLTWDRVRELVSMIARPQHDEARRGTVCVLTGGRHQPRGQVPPQAIGAAAVPAVYAPARQRLR
jgi:hypothetical protein